MDNNFNQEKVKALCLSMDSYNNDRNLIDKDHSQKLNFLKSIEQSNVKNLDSDNINTFNDSSQLHVNVSNEPQKPVHGLYKVLFSLLLVHFFKINK